VFEGNTADPATLAAQIVKLKQRFRLNRVVLIGDRGMITSARITETPEPAGSTGSPRCGRRRSVSSPAMTARCSSRCSTSAISPRSTARIIPASASSSATTRALAAEAALDGIYVLRTNLFRETLSAADTVRAYKSLAQVEHAFRSLKTVDLELRPVFHWTAPRVRAHVFLCMLAYYLEWHMRQALAPILFDDHDRAAGEALRASPVAKAQASPAAKRKATTKQTEDGLPVHSFRSLLADLATLTRNTVRCRPDATFTLLATATELQRRALDLLGLKPAP
jgi:Transposase DDE domain